MVQHTPVGTERDELARFLDGKRAAGYRYREEAGLLGALDRFLVSVLAPGDPILTLDIARASVAKRGSESESTRAHRLTLVREVCRFLSLEEPRTAVVPPRGSASTRAPGLDARGRPLVSSSVRALTTQPGSPIRDTVLGTALVLLCLTGLRAGEALRLTEADVDVGDAVVRVRDAKCGKSRLVPVAADVTIRLRQCHRVVARTSGRGRPTRPSFLRRRLTPTRSPHALPALDSQMRAALRASTRRGAGIPLGSNRSNVRIFEHAGTSRELGFGVGLAPNASLPTTQVFRGKRLPTPARSWTK